MVAASAGDEAIVPDVALHEAKVSAQVPFPAKIVECSSDAATETDVAVVAVLPSLAVAGDLAEDSRHAGRILHQGKAWVVVAMLIEKSTGLRMNGQMWRAVE